MTRSRDVADSQDNLGGAVAPVVSGKNLIINGGFDIWQRGTTFNNAQTLDYTTDRWFAYNDSVNTVNITQQNIASSGLGVRYAMRVERSSGSARWTMINMTEGALSLIGKTVTFSGYIRKGSGLTSSVNIDCGTRAVKYGSQYDGMTTISLSAANLSTTTWTKFSGTFNITTATSTNNADFFEIEITGASQAGATGAYFELAALQLEIGSVATPFARAGGSIGGELALCQRYYYRESGTAGSVTTGYGNAYSSVNFYSILKPKATMRIAPTSIDYSNLQALNAQTGVTASSAVLWGASSADAPAILSTTAGTFTVQSAWALGFSATGYIGFSAEL
jgi:hypothetical protein